MQRLTCVLVVFGLLLATAGLAFTLPTNQGSCATNLQTISAGSWQADSSLKVTVNNGTAARNVKIETSSETIVDTAGGVLELAYIIDGAGRFVGPAFFSTDNLNFGARTSMGVITLGPGVHTIVPEYFYSGGTNARVAARCLTAEKNTN